MTSERPSGGGSAGGGAAPRASLAQIQAELRARNALVGKAFGRLGVIGEIDGKPDTWLVKCAECGHEFEATGNDLRRNVERACGCDARAYGRRRAAQRRAFLVVAATAGIGLGAVGTVFITAWRYPDTAHGQASGSVEVEIPRGAGARQVAEILAGRGLIDRPSLFRLYAGQRGLAGRFKAGRYKIEAPATPRRILEELVKGVADELVVVTIPEGKSLAEIAALVEASGVTPRAEFIAPATDPAFVAGLGLPGPTLEGYLFPDTYKLRPAMPASRVLIQMVHRHRQVFAELRAANSRSVAELSRVLGFDDAKLVTLASIVEKETGQPAERPRIAQVFLNRLGFPTFQPKLLQTDPTIIYGCTMGTPRSAACAKFDGRIRRIHLEDKDNPYNTYTHEGLPPGPIANPGRAALQAVMQPDGSDFLYFVSKNDGTHQFSRTPAEHEAAVNRYQRGGRAPGDEPGARP